MGDVRKGAEKVQCISRQRILLISLFVAFVLASIYLVLPFICTILGVDSVVIISPSMTHPPDQAFFDSFWDELGASDLPQKKGFSPGDLVLFKKIDEYSIGDVVAVEQPGIRPVVHRLWQLNSTHFRVIADQCLVPQLNYTVKLRYDKATVTVVNDSFMQSYGDELLEDGPYYEVCSTTWLPRENMQKKVVLVMRMSGRLYLFLSGIEMTRSPYW